MAANTDTTTVREDEVPVSSTGRITIPISARKVLEVDGGDPIQVVVLVDGERLHFSAELDPKYRVRVPARIRNEHSIVDGDNIDIEVTST